MPRWEPNLRETATGIEKRCGHCKHWLPVPDAFYVDLRRSCGFSSLCTVCHINAQRKSVSATESGHAKAVVRDWLRAG